jgi:hypothetical protein
MGADIKKLTVVKVVHSSNDHVKVFLSDGSLLGGLYSIDVTTGTLGGEDEFTISGYVEGDNRPLAVGVRAAV